MPGPATIRDDGGVSDAPPDDLICSGKGCSEPAVYELGWNNPKLHTPDRRKIWLACAQHRDSLAEFLRARQFLRDVTPLA